MGFGRRVGPGVFVDNAGELVLRKDDDISFVIEFFGEGGFTAFFELFCGAGVVACDVSGLKIGFDVGEAEFGEGCFEVLHWDAGIASDVDAAEENGIYGHGFIVGQDEERTENENRCTSGKIFVELVQ